MKNSPLVVALMIGIASCTEAPVPSPPEVLSQANDEKTEVQSHANDNKKEKALAKVIDDDAFPKDWSIEEIALAARAFAVPGATHVLAWKRIGDNRPLVVDYCLVLCRWGENDWHLSSLARNPGVKGWDQWDVVRVHMGPGYKGFPQGAWVWHCKRYDKRPSNKDVYAFMDEHDWRLGVDEGWKLLRGAVCKTTWEAVVKEKPTRDFEK